MLEVTLGKLFFGLLDTFFKDATLCNKRAIYTNWHLIL
jgi:hypothetical protein